MPNRLATTRCPVHLTSSLICHGATYELRNSRPAVERTFQHRTEDRANLTQCTDIPDRRHHPWQALRQAKKPISSARALPFIQCSRPLSRSLVQLGQKHNDQTVLTPPSSPCPPSPRLQHSNHRHMPPRAPSTPPRHADAASGAYASGTCRAGPRDAEVAAANVSAFPACVSGLHGMRWHASVLSLPSWPCNVTPRLWDMSSAAAAIVGIAFLVHGRTQPTDEG